MADVGVIALDPVRLRGLEAYLQGLADGCRRRAGRVGDEVAGSGVPADRQVAELERLAGACRAEQAEVAHRRALVEALPDDLPLTARAHRGPAAAGAAGRALADDVVAAVEAHPPRWSTLARLLGELDRSAGSGAFAAAFFRRLGPRRARQLPLVLERSWRARRPASAGPADGGGPVVVAAQQRLADALRTASRVEGPDALSRPWARAYAGLPTADAAVRHLEAATPAPQRREATQVESTLRTAGYGLGLASSVAQAIGWRQAAAVLTADRGILGLVTGPMALGDGDGPECDGPEAVLATAAAGLTVVGAVTALPAAPLAVAAGVLNGLAVVFGACHRQEPRPHESRAAYDPSVGRSRLPSGHASNPHVDEAGVPFPPGG